MKFNPQQGTLGSLTAEVMGEGHVCSGDSTHHHSELVTLFPSIQYFLKGFMFHLKEEKMCPKS